LITQHPPPKKTTKKECTDETAMGALWFLSEISCDATAFLLVKSNVGAFGISKPSFLGIPIWLEFESGRKTFVDVWSISPFVGLIPCRML